MKIKKYGITVIVVLFIIALFSSISVLAAENTTEFFGGDGTENNPYIIGKKEHLNNVRNYPDSCFELVVDLTFEEVDFAEGGDFYNQGKGWEAFPTFTGIFDGGNKTIYGLTITAKNPASGMAGLFGRNEGTIKSLKLEGIAYKIDDKVSSNVYIGGIVAYNNGIVKNCNIAGDTLYSYFADESIAYIGGISGFNAGTIQNCSNMTNLSDESYYVHNGGIAGYNKGIISSCYNMGNIGYSHFSGGIAGTNENVINNCFNLGKIQYKMNSSAFIAGGICATNSGDISTSYNASLVKTDGDNPNISKSTGTVEDCYYYSCSLDWGEFSSGLTKEQMQMEQSFSGFDFSEIWMLDKNSEYPFPVLRNAEPILLSESSSDLFGGGTGFYWDPYVISTYEHFNNIRQFPDAFYIFTDNISISATNWEPFKFAGAIDGNGNTISINGSRSLQVYEKYYTSASYSIFEHNSGLISKLNIVTNLQFTLYGRLYFYAAGLVSYNDGMIHDCKINGLLKANEADPNYTLVSVTIGGVAGENTGIIKNCFNSSAINVDTQVGTIGGIAGNSIYGTIISCSNQGNLTALGNVHGDYNPSMSAGGIAGSISSAQIIHCTNNGDISASSITYRKSGHSYSLVYLYAHAGGIAGKSYNSDGMIANCINNGSISSSTNAGSVPSNVYISFSGGICGSGYYKMVSGAAIHAEATGNVCTITGCINNGNISTTSSKNGGGYTYPIYKGSFLGGFGKSGSNATYSYDTASSSATPEIDSDNFCYYLNAQTCSNPEMLIQDTYTGFDFENEWIMLPGAYPYPQLRTNLATPVKSIYVAKQASAPLECVNGHFVSYNGLKVGILFEDGTSVVAEPWLECFSLLDINSKGTHSIPLTVLECKTDDSVEIIVRDKRLTAIAVETQPTKTRYLTDEKTISLDGAVLQLTYDDTSTEIIDITSDMVSGFNPGVVGTQTLTVTYDDKTCPLYITVYEVSSISIKTPPSKTKYVQGQTISSQGGVLTVTYSDGIEEDFSLEVAELDYPKNLTGNIQATAKYLYFTTSFPITVNERIVKSMKIETEPSTTVYFIGEELDLSGGTIKVDFESDDNYYEIIPIDKSMVSGFDSSKIGYPTITVTYENKTDDFLVRVREYDSSFTQISLTRSNNEILVSAKRVPDFAVVYVAQYDINGRMLSLYATYDGMSIEIEKDMHSACAFLWNKNNISPYVGKITL